MRKVLLGDEKLVCFESMPFAKKHFWKAKETTCKERCLKNFQLISIWIMLLDK